MGKIRDRFLEKLFGSEWERLLSRAERSGARRFLLFWNRGLGDIALGLHQVIVEIRERLPDAKISIITRNELAEAFQLLPVDAVLVDEALVRGEKEGAQKAFARLAIQAGQYDVVLDQINPTKWFADRPRLQPRLHWPDTLDALVDRFDPDFEAAPMDAIYIGAHVQSETASFYGYQKDWPMPSWQSLMKALAAKWPVRFILFGHQSEVRFDASICVDLRGRTSFLEMMALIKNRCSILIAPDSGVLTMSYYLDAAYPIDLVSLWADPRQGILKQGVASPNSGLRHHPLLGREERVANIETGDVLKTVESILQARRL